MISRQIANAHTTFNVVCTLVWLPLIPIMVKIVTTIIRGEDKNTGVVYEPKYLDNKVIDQPVAAMYLVSQELENLTGFTVHMLNSLKGSLNQKRPQLHMKNSKISWISSSTCRKKSRTISPNCFPAVI